MNFPDTGVGAMLSIQYVLKSCVKLWEINSLPSFHSWVVAVCNNVFAGSARCASNMLGGQNEVSQPTLGLLALVRSVRNEMYLVSG